MNGGYSQSARVLAATDREVRGAYFDKLPPPQFSCGHCGQRFHTKKAKGQHKAACGKTAMTSAPADNEDELLYGRLSEHITPEIKAQAAAEWDAMDSRGRLPKGWEWQP